MTLKNIPIITASQLNRDATSKIDEARVKNKADLMAKNIEFKGLLNTVPYFYVWGNVWELWRKYVGG